MNRQLEKTRSTETCLTGLIGSTANQQKLREGYVFSVLTYNWSVLVGYPVENDCGWQLSNRAMSSLHFWMF